MIDREALILRRASLDEIACGCSVDHPDFDTVLDPLFEQTLVRLLDNAGKARREPSRQFSRLRGRDTRYLLHERQLDFAADADSAFEQVDADVMDRTVRHLKDRLALERSPKHVGAKIN